MQAGDGSEIVEPAVIGQWSPPTVPVQCSCTSIIRSHVVNNARSPLKSKECQQRWVPKNRLEEFSLIASSRAPQGFQGGRTVPPRPSSMATTLPPSSSTGAFLLDLDPDKQNLNVSTNSELFNDYCVSAVMEIAAAAWKACPDYFSLTATTIGERAFSTGEIARHQVKDCERENVGVNI